MFKLEHELLKWRRTMHTAGLEAGPVLDELESHLRDVFEEAVRNGVSENEAFASAASKLGSPRVLKREFEIATPWARARSILRADVPLFPADMRLCAWAAVLFGPYLMFAAIDTMRINRMIVDHHGRTNDDPFSFLLGIVLIFLVGLLGLTAAIGYLRRRSYPSARQLAAFWTVLFWVIGSLLILVLTRPPPTPVHLSFWMNMATIISAFATYQGWKRRLKNSIPVPV